MRCSALHVVLHAHVFPISTMTDQRSPQSIIVKINLEHKLQRSCLFGAVVAVCELMTFV